MYYDLYAGCVMYHMQICRMQVQLCRMYNYAGCIMRQSVRCIASDAELYNVLCVICGMRDNALYAGCVVYRMCSAYTGWMGMDGGMDGAYAKCIMHIKMHKICIKK